jgi:lysyl-tRNA synthetase class 1
VKEKMRRERRWEYKLDKLAEKAINKASAKNLPVVCRCGETPSGTKHIGNFNDNLRSYFIYLIVKRKGYPARHIQTRDNMDPFRKLPSGFYDLDKKWHPASEELIKAYERYVGTPLYFIPDPLGCCANYAEHFRIIYEKECEEMGLKDTEYFCTKKLYEEGKFNPYLRKIFEKEKIAREIILSVETTKPKDYIPVWAICENCGKITGRITKVYLEEETADYVCIDRYLTPKYKAIGCGYKGTVNWNNGRTKMDWEFEWPAQMLMFQTTIEPFGKEHFIGSWPISKQVIEKVYEGELPIVFFYEYFLIDGRKMATRHGNIVTLSLLLEILEPEVIRYLYTKKPEKQRNIDLSRTDRLVDEFDRAERVYFGLEKARNEKEEIKLKRSYELAMLYKIPREPPKRINYRTAVKIIQRYPRERWKKEIEKFTEFNENIEKRLILAKNWLALLNQDKMVP